MQQHQTILQCSQKTAFITFVILGTLFTLTGCAQLYKTLGLTDEQTQDQVSQDHLVATKIITQVRTATADIVTTALAGLGAIASGILAKWLGTERKMTTALITGIEAAHDISVKAAVKDKAMIAGIQTKLAKRVARLT